MNIDQMLFVQHLAATAHQNAVQQLIAYAAIDWMLNDFFGPLFLALWTSCTRQCAGNCSICMFCSAWKAKLSFIFIFIWNRMNFFLSPMNICRWMSRKLWTMRFHLEVRPHFNICTYLFLPCPIRQFLKH